MSLMDKVKHLVVEEDDTAAPVAPVASSTPQSYNFNPVVTPSYSIPVMGSTTVDSNTSTDMYTSLVNKTNFDTTPVGKLFNKYYDMLKDLPIDEKTKITKVLALGANEGLTAQALLAAIDQLKGSLDNENNNFQSALASRTETEINQRKKQLEQLAQQMADAQKKQGDVSTDLINAQVKIQNAASTFQGAYTRRQQDLDGLKTKYTAIFQ